VKFGSVLVANRGEIALRVMRTARRMGLRTIAVYSDADREAPHVRAADDAARIGPAPPRESYLAIAALIDAAKRTGADAVHPGYGFLAESADFAQAVLDAGLVWIGPSPAAIRAMGDKGEAKRIASKAGVPVLPEYRTHGKIDFPVMVKAAAGGGGRGMRLVRSAAELPAALASARSEAEHAFGDGRLVLEPAIEEARHVEVQVFADRHGSVVHLGERDCSVQRRHQKLIEESPSPAVDAALREKLTSAALALARAVGYEGAGTVEFLLGQGREFWFMEMNTRLQVEHTVTEMVTGLDLVEWQLRVAAGEPLPLAQDAIGCSGHAIEARLCAEDPAGDFLPQSGRVLRWRAASEARTEHALESGAEVPAWYDSLIAKVICHGGTRDEARERLARALDATVALGLPTNKAFLAGVLRDPVFAAGKATTAFLASRRPAHRDPEAADLAIAAALLAQAAGRGEWNCWSNNPAREMRFRFGREVALRPEDLRLRSPRDEVTDYVIAGDTVHFARGGSSFSLRNSLYDPPERKGVAAGDGRLAAPMSGRVVAVHARAGERIDAGQALVVLEAMKMEHGLALQVPVTVKAVHVATGAQVAPGQLLAEFEPAA